MPTPKNVQAAPEPAPEVPSSVDTNPIITAAVHAAKELEYQRHTMSGRIDANRQMLRLLDQNEMLDEETGAWLDDFYPVREKGSARDDEAQKRSLEAKKAARDEIEAQYVTPDTPEAA